MHARLYDGVTGHPHAVTVEFETSTIRLSQASGWRDEVVAQKLKRLESAPGVLRLGRADIHGWRLVLPSNAAHDVDTLLGKQERYGRWIDRVGLLPALLLGALVTGCVVTLGYSTPSWLAPHVPMSWERDVGSALVGDFGSIRCRDPAGQQA
ncbi:MAG TPA: hypothetical protein VE968_07665, partial [Sphingomicrobium sp.]|nr:hypothetical protein [Sphingomicrobium sp.]